MLRLSEKWYFWSLNIKYHNIFDFQVKNCEYLKRQDFFWMEWRLVGKHPSLRSSGMVTRRKRNISKPEISRNRHIANIEISRNWQSFGRKLKIQFWNYALKWGWRTAGEGRGKIKYFIALCQICAFLPYSTIDDWLHRAGSWRHCQILPAVVNF